MDGLFPSQKAGEFLLAWKKHDNSGSFGTNWLSYGYITILSNAERREMALKMSW